MRSRLPNTTIPRHPLTRHQRPVDHLDVVVNGPLMCLLICRQLPPRLGGILQGSLAWEGILQGSLAWEGIPWGSLSFRSRRTAAARQNGRGYRVDRSASRMRRVTASGRETLT